MNCYLTFYFPCPLTEPERRACPRSPEQSKQDGALTFPSTTPPPPRGPRTLLPPSPPAARGWKQPTHLHEPPGLTDDGVLEAIQGKAINLLHDSDWGLPNLPHQGVGSVHCRRGRLRVWDQLNQWHMIWWIYLMRDTEGERVKRQLWSWGAVLADPTCPSRMVRWGRFVFGKASLDLASNDKELEI